MEQIGQHRIEVQVVYAPKSGLWSKTLVLGRGSTPEDLLEQSGFFTDFPELRSEYEANKLAYGVYSQRVDQNYLLQQGDRLEVYRPLTADPKQVRRELAKLGKTMVER